MDCSLPSSSVHRISQARILEWVAISFSRGSSQPRDQTCVSCIGRCNLYRWATEEAPIYILNSSKLNHIISILLQIDYHKRYIFLNIYLAAVGFSCGTWDIWFLLRHARSLVAACELLVVACGIQFPDQRWNLGSLLWEWGVPATGPPCVLNSSVMSDSLWPCGL